MATADKVFGERCAQAHILLDDKLVEILNILKRILPDEKIFDCLNRFSESLDGVLNDYIKESLDKETAISLEIQNTINEANQLGCLLGIELKWDRRKDNVPLVLLLAQLDEKVERLKKQLECDRRKINEFQQEQEEFCKALLEAPLPKSPDHLSTKVVLEELDKNFDDLVKKAEQRLYKLCDNREKLRMQRSALDCKANDPKRLKNRQGQLLKEEKERKVIARKLFKVDEHIRKLVAVYEAHTHKDFLVDGKNILNLIKDDVKRPAPKINVNATKSYFVPIALKKSSTSTLCASTSQIERGYKSE